MPRNQTEITVTGNMVADPELRFTPDGVALCKFRVAFTPRHFRDGEWKDGDSSFYDCVAWRQLAENVAETFLKGHRVVLVGRQRQEHWEYTPEGGGEKEKRSRWVVDVDDIGASVSFATCKIKKMVRAGSAPEDDAWANASTTRPEKTTEPTPAAAVDVPAF